MSRKKSSLPFMSSSNSTPIPGAYHVLTDRRVERGPVFGDDDFIEGTERDGHLLAKRDDLALVLGHAGGVLLGVCKSDLGMRRHDQAVATSTANPSCKPRRKRAAIFDPSSTTSARISLIASSNPMRNG